MLILKRNIMLWFILKLPGFLIKIANKESYFDQFKSVIKYELQIKSQTNLKKRKIVSVTSV